MRLSENALQYVGEMEVKKDVTPADGKDNPVYGNFSFVHPAFQAELVEEGWHPGWAWCAIFAKVVAKNCFPYQGKVLDSLFSPSAVQTFNNFKKAGYTTSVDKDGFPLPVVDSVVIWQHYSNGHPTNIGTADKPILTGHAGIVVSVNAKDPAAFESVEGNTSTPGEREGYIVARNPHRASHDVNNGLRVLGFITIK